MKQQERKPRALGKGGETPPSLEDLKAIRLAQKATNQRVDDLKMQLFRLTERHMDQAVRLLRRWMGDTSKK